MVLMGEFRLKQLIMFDKIASIKIFVIVQIMRQKIPNIQINRVDLDIKNWTDVKIGKTMVTEVLYRVVLSRLGNG